MYDYALGDWKVWIPPRLIEVEGLDDVVQSSRAEPGGGAFSLAVWPRADCMLGKVLSLRFGRPDLALKVFKAEASALTDFRWGYESQTRLAEATAIQNLYAREGLAPRVYGLVLLRGPERQWWAQVTDWAPSLPTRVPLVDKSAEAANRGKFGVTACIDPNPENWVNGYLVDFQSHSFEPRGLENCRVRILEEAEGPCAWGSRPEIYQDIPEWNVVGQRDSARRMRELGLEEMDFTGKSVLDVGCNVGTMSRLAARLGASRVVGLDGLACARIASEISVLLGYWNLDFHGCNLGSVDPREIDGVDSKFDIVLYLSQFKFPVWAHEMCSGTMLFEGHVGQHRATFEDQLTEHFEVVEYRGKTRDHGPRPYFVCRKGCRKGRTR